MFALFVFFFVYSKLGIVLSHNSTIISNNLFVLICGGVDTQIIIFYYAIIVNSIKNINFNSIKKRVQPPLTISIDKNPKKSNCLTFKPICPLFLSHITLSTAAAVDRVLK